MKLSEALRIVQTPIPSDAEKLGVFFACGFTPLHLVTFLTACLHESLPERNIEIQTGLYGDLAGNLEKFNKSCCYVGAVVIEWSDLDPRLGLRSLGGWGPQVLADIQENSRLTADRILRLLKNISQSSSIALCLPTLPLPPVSYLPNSQLGLHELLLKGVVQDFALNAASLPNIKILNHQQLDEITPLSERFDVKSELTTGFPYRTAFAAKIAGLLAQLIHPQLPKKGLITDLDDTLWRGILGEDGVMGISWDLDKHSHIHALYQQTLKALAESGVLIGVASKNDQALVMEAFERKDLVLSKNHLFPLEINWQQKSKSVERILEAWNIGADAVVFLDDSPLELAEVRAVYPEMECMLFPKNNDAAVYQLLRNLRSIFGKQEILEEDAIRVQSLRSGKEFQVQAQNRPHRSLDSFLEHLEAELTFSPVSIEDARAFELINKTNQFNLNGRRMNNIEFQTTLQRQGAVSLTISYQDKYGPLGKIAVLLGRVELSILKIDTWVMSCRAFSRHIEYKCLEYLFDNLGVSEIELDYNPTTRNSPVQEFLSRFFDQDLNFPYRITREMFMSRKPALFHNVIEVSYV